MLSIIQHVNLNFCKQECKFEIQWTLYFIWTLNSFRELEDIKLFPMQKLKTIYLYSIEIFYLSNWTFQSAWLSGIFSFFSWSCRTQLLILSFVLFLDLQRNISHAEQIKVDKKPLNICSIVCMKGNLYKTFKKINGSRFY